ncbi:hypothetical protein [Lelliottia wanjuensis]|uniref:hypothetical protein n=1 Tax=Lelliottia wanjuensis TaxID=3050585 RepID=UPI00254EF203|nr:hypothetical protein [Lelliottia sp. V104_15]MDK9607258.1 hypothetical protein [Lelliottia sp. V104_15]
MTIESNNSSLYTELACKPDLLALAERCNLLTEILIGCNLLPQLQPICRCLDAYLSVVKQELAESMSDFYVVDLEEEPEEPKKREWLLEETETKCDYCRALNHVLLVSHFDRDMLPHLTGLLHDITHAMTEDLVAPFQPQVVIHFPAQPGL